MTVFVFSVLVFLGAVVAGFIGSLTGLGGGLILTPLLVIVFGVDLPYAMGASLVSVISTSCGAAAAYVRDGFANLRIGLLLEIATTLGALGGAYAAAYCSHGLLAVLFGLVMLYSAWTNLRLREAPSPRAAVDPLAARLRLDGEYPTPEGPQAYHVRRVPAGFVVMGVAGLLSGLLGIGSGAVKVLALDRCLGLPFKVSTATSNFMIGVTAAASAGVYLARGYIHPVLAMPVMLGVLLGALFGARVLPRAKSSRLRLLFTLLVICLGLQMLFEGVTGRI